MTDPQASDQLGPPFTILRVVELVNGGARVLARRRGGRVVNLYVPPVLNNGPDIERLVALVLDQQPPYPPRT